MFLNNFKVMDIHAHLPYPIPFIKRNEVNNKYNKERGERMRLTWDFPDPSQEDGGAKDLPIIDRWLAELDKYGIDRLNFLTANDNEDLAEQIGKYPNRFTGFAHHSIEDPEALDKLKKSKIGRAHV